MSIDKLINSLFDSNPFYFIRFKTKKKWSLYEVICSNREIAELFFEQVCENGNEKLIGLELYDGKLIREMNRDSDLSIDR